MQFIGYFRKFVSKVISHVTEAKTNLARKRKEKFARTNKPALKQEKQFARQVAVLAMMITVAAGSVVTAIAVSEKAVVMLDGETKPEQIITSRSTEDILASAGVTAGKDDLVVTEEKDGRLNITVRTAQDVFVTADGITTKVRLHWGDSVAAALSGAGVTLGGNDSVSPSLSTVVHENMSITVKRRYSVSITADGQTHKLLAWEGTVEATLAGAGVNLGEEDIVSANLQAPISQNETITVSRIGYQDVTKTETVAYKSTTKKDSAKTVGTKAVITAGKNGVKTTVLREKLMDGKVVSTSVVSSGVTTQPVNEVVAVGTRPVGDGTATVLANGTLLDADGDTVSYRKVFTGRCTSYCYGSWTASGLPARRGTVAVNPNIIPYGTKLYICSPNGKVVYGYAVAADTGTAAMEGSIVADLYYTTLDECIQFGSRTMNVYVLN